MRTTHIRLSTVLALGFAWCALPVHAQWLAPGAGYDAGAAGATTLGAGWSVLNAQTEAEQNTQLDYTVTADTDGQDTYLDFANGALASTKTLYLALGISQNAADTAQQPVVMSPLGAGLFRIDNVTAKVRFEQSAAAPELDDLRALYTDYKQQGQPNAAVAAKAALYLGTDNHFYVARARPDETGTSEQVVFDWCRTEVDYADLGGGAVNVRFQFCTFRLTEPGEDVPTRAYRILVSNPADPTSEVCLTKGLGFPWLSNPNDGYVFDFSTLGTGDWFYAIDSASIAAGQGALDTSVEAVYALDKLNQLAFSASGGGFYSAQIAQTEATSIDSLNLENYDTGDFAAYLRNDAGKTLVQEWALEYGVTLTDYLQPNGARLMAANQRLPPLRRPRVRRGAPPLRYRYRSGRGRQGRHPLRARPRGGRPPPRPVQGRRALRHPRRDPRRPVRRQAGAALGLDLLRRRHRHRGARQRHPETLHEGHPPAQDPLRVGLMDAGGAARALLLAPHTPFCDTVWERNPSCEASPAPSAPA